MKNVIVYSSLLCNIIIGISLGFSFSTFLSLDNSAFLGLIFATLGLFWSVLNLCFAKKGE